METVLGERLMVIRSPGWRSSPTWPSQVRVVSGARRSRVMVMAMAGSRSRGRLDRAKEQMGVTRMQSQAGVADGPARRRGCRRWSRWGWL